VLGGVPVITTTSSAGEVCGFNFCACTAGHCPRTLISKEQQNVLFFSPFEELKNIENRVAWFLAKVQGISSPILELHEVLKAKSTKTV